MLFSPFEQFEITLLNNFSFGDFDFSLTNLTLLVLLVTSFLMFATTLVSASYSFIPNNWQNLLEMIYLFVLSIVSEQAGKKGYRYFPHFFTIFMLVLLYNLIGLLPFSFTVSSHIVITLTLAFSYFVAWIIVAVKELGAKFLYVFCPKNMPAWLLPLLVVVEILSFLLRPFSLGIRLFANMLAGHILLHILAGAFIFVFSLSFFLVIPVFVIIAAVGILELGISFLQAYIFTILLTIYLKDSLISH